VLTSPIEHELLEQFRLALIGCASTNGVHGPVSARSRREACVRLTAEVLRARRAASVKMIYGNYRCHQDRIWVRNGAERLTWSRPRRGASWRFDAP
jgi:hypothetical protein